MARQKIVRDETYQGFRYIVKHFIEMYEDNDIGGSYRNWYTGYVIIPKGHKFYGVDDADEDVMNLEVHGEITFADVLPEVGEFALGFDCAHFGDNPFDNDERYACEECENLIQQIKEKEFSFKVSFDATSLNREKLKEVLKGRVKNLLDDEYHIYIDNIEINKDIMRRLEWTR